MSVSHITTTTGNKTIVADVFQLTLNQDTVAARLVVELSPLRVRRNGTRFHTHSETLLGVPTSADRLWRLISSQR